MPSATNQLLEALYHDGGGIELEDEWKYCMDDSYDSGVNQNCTVDQSEQTVFPITLRVLGVIWMFGKRVHILTYKI